MTQKSAQALIFSLSAVCVWRSTHIITIKLLSWQILIHAQVQLLRNWADEWSKVIDTRHVRLQMTLLFGDVKDMAWPELSRTW